jgi:hypothetical protein
LQIVAGISHAMLELVHLVLDLLETAKRSERRLMDRRAGLEVNVLVQQAEFHATGTHDVAAIRCLIASDETKDRALSGAVAADKTDVFTGIHLQCGATQNVLSAVGFVNF